MRQVSSLTSSSAPPGMAPALFTRMSMLGKSLASWSTFLLSDRSAATVSTRTFDFCAIADFAAASVSALRDTMITLQPSPAKTSAVARPMPFEPPVINAVLPASLRPMKPPWETTGEEGNYDGAGAPPQRCCGMSGHRLDHAANALAMPHFRAEAEVARRFLDIHWTARSGGLGVVYLKPHRIACGTA